MRDSSPKTRSGSPMFLHTLRSAVIASALSIILVVAFAFALQQQWLKAESIPIINPIIKVLAAITAALLTVKRSENRPWLWGMAGGAIFMLLTFVLFSILSGNFELNIGLLIDLAMCALAGASVGVIKNLRGA